MTTPNDPTMSHSSLDAIIAAYMQAVEAGDVPNRDELLAVHPEHVEALQAFFADLDRMDRVASPLRLAAGLDETFALDANGNSALPTIRYFGDYELLEEIARGGMGIVYKARQVSLNRIVALKMILRGTFATEKDVARFRAEAESAANLDHPHIVPIHEVGEHEGHQYYTMKFVEGTSLSKLPQSDPHKEVEGIVPVIRAVHHAHQRGVLHRDLKPSNVLVDSQGTRFVTDFGLAKRLADADRSLTEPGQILGTPRYMAPEQAAGSKDLTVAADVYSLGVILYERLTGQTPFTGDDALALLRQVQESEPPRPSTIRTGLDRDLETVVLKCLNKEPNRRYSSCETLADDVDRWLRGEPITARPVGRLEKTWLWARRNPAIATAGGLAAAALVAVAVVSSVVAIQANALAKAERQRKEDAIAARDSVEWALARSYLAPLNVELNGEGHDLFTNEANALWQLAENPGERIWLRFIDLGTRDPFALQQLGARSEPAMIAAVGLDRTKRDQAATLLASRLFDPALHPEQKREVANVALELECCADTPRPEGRLDTNVVAQERIASLEARPSGQLAKQFVAIAELLEPSEAAILCDRASRALVTALKTAKDPGEEDDLCDGLCSVAARMEPDAAAGMLVSILMKSEFPDSLLVFQLASVAGRMTPAAAAKTCGPLAQKLATELREWAAGPGDYGPRGRPLAQEKYAQELVAVAARVGPAKAAAECGPIARMLASLLATNPRHGSVDAFAAVAELIEPAEAAELSGRVGDALAAALQSESEADVRGWLAQKLALLADRLEPTEAAKLYGRAHQTLYAAFERETNPLSKASLASGLGAIASRMKPESGAHLMIDTMKNRLYGMHRRQWTSSLISLARRMPPAKAEAVCSEAIRLYLEERGGDHDAAFLLSQLSPAKATGIARILSRSMCSETYAGTNSYMPSQGGTIGAEIDLDAVLSVADRLRAPTKIVASTATDGLVWVGVVAPGEPRTCRLTTQELVELLKMPTCNGALRRVVLDHLGNIHTRRFASHWDFVRFAKEHGLELDFTTPPKRPDPKESVKRMLELLDRPN